MPELVAAFRYADVDPGDRAILRDTVESIRGLCARTCANLLRVGQLLALARARVPKGTFCAWAESEFPWCLKQTYRLIDVAAAFADPARACQIDKFEPSALYAIAATNTPPAAREYALQLAADGERITHRTAREILDAHRPQPTPSTKDARELAPDTPKAEPPRLPSLEEQAWAALVHLWGRGSVHVTALSDGGGADDADDAGPPASVTVYAEGDRPRNFVRRNPVLAVLAAAGREPKKKCPRCKKNKDVSLFSVMRRTADELNTYCKDCERKRRKVTRRAERAKKKRLKAAGELSIPPAAPKPEPKAA